jgi:ABC-type multidrug transport system fused ATPase/permease subunit
MYSNGNCDVVISDQIAVLERGRLVEKGTYSGLLSMENGTFRKLVQHQTFAAS